MKEKITEFAVWIPYYIGCATIAYGVCKLSDWVFDKIEDRIHECKKAKKNHG